LTFDWSDGVDRSQNAKEKSFFHEPIKCFYFLTTKTITEKTKTRAKTTTRATATATTLTTKTNNIDRRKKI
jgi:hypothetical protein